MLSDRCPVLCCPVCDVGALWPNGQTNGPGHIVLDGDPAPLPKEAEPPNFRPNICCGQMAAWVNIPLGMEVGLGPGDFMLDGDPAPLPKKGVEPPKFSADVDCGQTAVWIKMALGMEVGLSPDDCVRWGPSPPKFSAHVYYSYCDFVRTLHSRYWFVQVQVLVLYAFYF